MYPGYWTYFWIFWLTTQQLHANSTVSVQEPTNPILSVHVIPLPLNCPTVLHCVYSLYTSLIWLKPGTLGGECSFIIINIEHDYLGLWEPLLPQPALSYYTACCYRLITLTQYSLPRPSLSILILIASKYKPYSNATLLESPVQSNRSIEVLSAQCSRMRGLLCGTNLWTHHTLHVKIWTFL